MFVFLTILNDVFQTYLDSLKKDLGAEGFKMLSILALLSWAGLFIAAWLLINGQFRMPGDPLFYLFWLGLALLTEVSFALFLSGLIKANFLRPIALAISALS